jgi:hypothetical protein
VWLLSFFTQDSASPCLFTVLGYRSGVPVTFPRVKALTGG